MLLTFTAFWASGVRPFTIGHMIFFTREKYRMTNHKPDSGAPAAEGRHAEPLTYRTHSFIFV